MAHKKDKTKEDLELEELELKVEELRDRARRPWWRRLEIPWLIAVAALVFQILDGSRKADLEERKLIAEKEKAQSDAGSFKTSLDAVTISLSRLQTQLESRTAAPQAPPPSSTSVHKEFESQLEREAQENIRWVIERDQRARHVYDQAKARNGGDRFGAVLAAQAHNPRAKQVIEQYGKDKAVAFIESLKG